MTMNCENCLSGQNDTNGDDTMTYIKRHNVWARDAFILCMSFFAIAIAVASPVWAQGSDRGRAGALWIGEGFWSGTYAGAGFNYGPGVLRINNSEDGGADSLAGATFLGGHDYRFLSRGRHDFYMGFAVGASILERTLEEKTASYFYELETSYDVDVGGRLGYAPHDDAFAFAQVGYSLSNFNGYYRDANATSATRDSQVVHGYHYGIGMEGALMAGSSIRIDWMVRDRESFGLGTYAPTTTFDGRDFTSRLALVFRFGKRPEGKKVIEVDDSVFNGLYLGIKGHHSVSGNARSDGSDTRTMGFEGIGTGGYVGIGTHRLFPEHQDIYLGVEFQGETTLSDSHEVYEGRGESVRRPMNFDLGVRVGYLPHPTTMIYLSSGYSWVQMKFNSTSGIQKEEFLDGFSLGAGIETLLYQNLTMRFDWTYADVGDFRIDGANFIQNVQENRINFGVSYAFDVLGL